MSAISPPSESKARRVRRTQEIAKASPREARQQAMTDARRSLILGAARAAFFELGLEGTSIRAIAQRAGYAPGAIYSYFSSKEEVYGALLAESLQRLHDRVARARALCEGDGAQRLRAVSKAFFSFYEENPRELDLGFYLFNGARPRGLTPALNATLNQRLAEALRPAQEALEELGLSREASLAEVTAVFAHSVGLLILSHTGRIRMFKQAPQSLFDAYLEQLLARIFASRRALDVGSGPG